jgi:hypothetical protein
MSNRKVPDTCAKCDGSAKSSHYGLEPTWRCFGFCGTDPIRYIPCRPGRLPLPLKDCPRRKA